MSRVRLCLALLSFLVFATAAHAAPLSVRIEDHDFSFDVPYWQPPAGGPVWGAVYNYNGVAPDSLTLQAPNPNHYAVSYSYTGALPTVPGAPAANPFPYPITNTATFGGDLKLDMAFAVNDGPYVDAITGDRFDISLVGTSGSLTITGQIWSQGFPFPAPIYPAAPVPNDIVLLSIVFDKVTLLARVNEDRIFKIEGVGNLTTLLGEDMTQPGSPFDEGCVAFDFIAKNPLGPIFTNPGYDPMKDLITTTILGDISGHTGLPEPATMAMLAIGGLALVLRRRR